MSVLIINSPLYREPGDHYDEVLPPIGLGYICTNLKENGFSVELFDAVAGKVPLDEIIDYIEHGNFSHVGLNIFSTNHRLVEEITSRVSEEITFIIGGAFTKSNYQDIANWNTNHEINVIIGEADTIISSIISGKIDEKPIFENGNKKVYKVDKSSKYFPQDISSLNIDRNFFQYEPTISAKSGKPEGNIIVSRGCVYDCAFCSAAISLNKGNKIRIRTSESVRNEILQIRELYPEVQSIRILDDLFLKNIKSINDAIEIFSQLNLEWRAMAHIQSFKKVEDNLLNEMKQTGCTELSIGVESGNDDILRMVNKASTTGEVKQTIERVFRAGISVKGYFIIGFPGETKEQFEDTYILAKYLKELSLIYGVDFRISVFQFRPYHGTQIYYDLTEQGHIIGDIEPSDNIRNKKIGEYDFGNGNFSGSTRGNIKNYVEKTRLLNDLSLKFIPYYGTLEDFPKNGVFFVGLSHKLGKEGNILEAFCNSTNSGKIISTITSSCETSAIYKTNLVRGVPIDGNKKIRYPNEQEKSTGIEFLVREIDLYKPRIVFLFGKQVSDFVIRKLQPIKTDENEYKYRGATFILAEHPSYIAVYKRNQIDNYVSGITKRIDVMNWSTPHITKIPEALGAIADGRFEIGNNNTAKVFSSSRNKFYTIMYNPADGSIMSNDNASYWNGSLGYPTIAYLMQIGKIPYDAELAEAFSGIPWKDLNQQFQNDFDKTWEFLLSDLAEKGYDRDEIERKILNIQDFITSRGWKMNGEKTVPPEGY